MADGAIQVSPSGAPAPAAIVNTLANWFEQEGRVFCWRTLTDPYAILVAEILLRKTGARSVDQYLPHFLAMYPRIENLAAASQDVLTRELGVLGLGTQRARQLHQLAHEVMGRFGGRIPREIEQLLSLPGVGRYTAGIVAATAFALPTPAVDTNVARVVCRVFGITPSRCEARKCPIVWSTAGLLHVGKHAGVRVTWALLDLAALYCTARRPRCPDCPLHVQCVFRRGVAAGIETKR